MTDRFQDKGLSRRRFLQASAAGLGTVVAWQVLGERPGRATAPASGPAAVPIAFDTDWLFGPSVGGGTAADFDDSGLVTVTVPHTVTPLSWREWDPATWERTWLYRKHFDAPPGSEGMRVFIDFDAALTGATLTMNDQELPGHVGGYLPFTAELTDVLQPTGNVLAVMLDSGFNIDVPPDRPAPQVSSSVDYWQPGGIYRDVHLRVVPQVFLADVFAKPTQVLDAAQRSVEVELALDAAVLPHGTVTITVDLRDGSRKVASTRVPVSIDTTGQTTAQATLTGLGSITLWDIDNPHLYDVVATLSINDTAIHDYRTRIGFREATFQLDGFYLNGRRVQLFGVNRHQGFPFTGFAMPARVQRKDAEILRTELNCNMVRCSHYPQSAAFLDACDELGLLVWEEMPGWGFFGDAAWAAAGLQDVHDMVVRDRNRPSIVVWGAMPNEAGNHLADYTTYHELAHSLDDSRPTGGDSTAGNTASYVFDVFSIHDYSHQVGPDGLQQPTLQRPVDVAGKPYLVCEAVGTLSGPALFYRRIDTQQVQQGQATAHARVHDIAASDDRYCGVLAWGGIDYGSGSGNIFQEIKYIGVVDLFRVPKPGAAIYQAQLDPQVRPVIAPAFYWDFGPTSPINQLGPAMICANLDRLEVYLAGAHFATVTPDTTNYGHLRYPPSFVDFTGVDGSGHPELRIDGYLGSTKVASQSFSSDPAGDRLHVTIDDTELTGDGSDATRVAFRAVDRYGQPRPYVQGDVTLSVDGPAALIGDNPFAFADTGAAGAVWLRTIRDTPGTVTLTARHPTLGSAAVTARIRQATPGGAPAPYGTLQASASLLPAVQGAPTTLGATFTNNGLPNLSALALSLQLPADWSARASTGTSFTGVKSGQHVDASWQITPPADTVPGSYDVTVTAAYTAHGERGVSATTVTFAVAGVVEASSAPLLAEVGQPTPVVVNFTSRVDRPITVDYQVELPTGGGITVSPDHGSVTVPPEGTSITLTATAADVGSFHLPVDLTTTVQGEVVALRPTALDVVVAFASLAAAFNNVGITSDSDRAPGDFDSGVNGDSYSAEALADLGITPGSTITKRGIDFTWPNVPAGVPDNVTMLGQGIAFSGSGTTLGFIGAANQGTHAGTVTVFYTDGTTQQATISFPDYFTSALVDDDDLIATIPYLNSRTLGRRPIPVSLFAAYVPLDPTRTVVGVQFPTVRGGGNGGDKFLHVFSMAIG